jgi:hypothetical protein
MEYKKIYYMIIEKAQNENRKKNNGVYYESHHITPRCLGGEGGFTQLNHPNIVLLTAKEHFLCHKLLIEMYPNNPDLWYALFLMSINKNKKIHQRYKITSREYERIKLNWYNYSKGRKKPEGFGGKIKSEKRNKKIGIANSKPKPKGFGENHSEKMKGRKKPDNFGEFISNRNSKPLLQYDKNMNFIKEWENAVIAGKILNINKSIINAVARQNGINHTAGGFIWRYKD